MDSFTINKEFVENDYECQKDIAYQIEKFNTMSKEDKDYALYVLYSCCKIFDSMINKEMKT